MKSHKFFETVERVAVVFSVACCFCVYGFAQRVLLSDANPSIEALALVRTVPAETPGIHKFWDKKNSALFAAGAVFSAADFAVTRANLRSGGSELNPMVRVVGKSTPGLAVNFASQAVGVVGLSYMFHKTGHHKLERIASLINIGASGAAATYGLTHR